MGSDPSLHDPTLPVHQPSGIFPLQSFCLTGSQPDDELCFQCAECHDRRGEVACGVSEGCCWGPVGIAQQAPVVGITFDENQIHAGQNVMQIIWQLEEEQARRVVPVIIKVETVTDQMRPEAVGK